jgi:hypothetical protein
MQTARPTFNVKALKTGAGSIIEAIWPDGRAERLVGLFINPEHAAKWVNEHGDSWIELNQPSYGHFLKRRSASALIRRAVSISASDNPARTPAHTALKRRLHSSRSLQLPRWPVGCGLPGDRQVVPEHLVVVRRRVAADDGRS